MNDTLALLNRRRSVAPVNLAAPGPDAEQLRALLGVAARVPDHGKLAPWRFLVIEGEGRDAAGHGLYDKISDGWADLEDLISGIIEKHPTLTLRTFFAGQRDSNSAVVAGGYPGYAPSADPRGANQPNAYASYMAAQMKIALDDPLVSFLPPTAYPNPPTVA